MVYAYPLTSETATPPASVTDLNLRLFTVGAIGQFLFAGAAIANGLFYLRFVYYTPYGVNLLWLLLTVALGISLFIQLAGFLAIGRSFQSGMGYGAFTFGLLTTVVMLVSRLLYEAYWRVWFDQTAIVGALYVASFVMLAVLFILEGATFIAVRETINNIGGSVSAGVLFIVAGSFVCTFYLYSVGFVLAAFASIVAGLLLFQVKSRSKPAEGAQLTLSRR